MKLATKHLSVPRRTWALAASWTLVLLVLLTLAAGAPFTLTEPLSAEQATLLALYLATSAFWIPRWRRPPVVLAHLGVVALVLALHPLTTAFGRDGAFAVTALHLGFVVAWLTSWKPERKLLVVALVAGLALVETILSSYREGPRYPREGLRDYGDLMGPYRAGGFLLPNLDERVVGPHGPVEFVTNAQGFRNRHEVGESPPPGRRRIVIVGDSFVAGYRTGQERTVGRQLELLLQERWGPDGVEVLVAGAGHPAAARKWLAENGFAFHPDLVVLGVTLGNDVAQTWLAARKLQVPLLESLLLPAEAFPDSYRGLLPVKLDRTLRSWRLYRRVRRLVVPEVIFSWFRDFPTRVHLFDPGHALGLFLARSDHPLVEDALHDLLDSLGGIQAESSANDTAFLVALIPQRFQLGSSVWSATTFEYGLDPRAFDPALPNRRIVQGCAERRVTCLDLLAGFQAAAETPLYQPLGDMHWSDAGHRRAAELIARAIEEDFSSLAPGRDRQR